MVNDGLIQSWYLGTGGERPGVMLVSPSENQARGLLELPRGQSVYAAALDFRNGLLAVGTRMGQIVVLALPQEESGGRRVLQSLEQGAPVLSVCFVSGGRLASTDTTGRCLLWKPFTDAHNPRALETGGGIVCSILELSDGTLLGLSSTGRLLRWDSEDGHIVKSTRCPVPPGKLALVKLAHWPRQNAVAYPGNDGRLVLCELDAKARLHTSKAHEGAFYAVFVVGQDLCTVGASDGLLKVWQEVASTPAWQCEAPTGVIGGGEAGQGDGQILLITCSGQAAIHAIQTGQLRLQRALAENHCRAVASATPQARLEVLRELRMTKARQLCSRIEEWAEAGQAGGVDALHQQLTDLGYRTVSLMLRARQAASKKDILGELRIRHSLAQVLPANDPLAATSLYRYSHVLQASWLLRDALTVHARIKDPQKSEVIPEWLEQTAKAMDGSHWVAHADSPISELVESATIVGRPFAGRWVLNVLGAVPFPEGHLTAEALARKYEQVRDEGGRSGLPAAEARSLCWLSRHMPRTIATVLLVGPADPATEGAELAVQVLDDGLQTILVEHLLFHAGEMLGEGQSPQDHNRRTAEVLERIGRPERVGPWLLAVRRAMNRALQRLHTEAVHRRKEGTGHAENC